MLARLGRKPMVAGRYLTTPRFIGSGRRTADRTSGTCGTILGFTRRASRRALSRHDGAGTSLLGRGGGQGRAGRVGVRTPRDMACMNSEKVIMYYVRPRQSFWPL